MCTNRGGILTIYLTYTHRGLPYFNVSVNEFLATMFFMVGHYYHKSKIIIHEKNWFFIVAIILVVVGSIYWPTEFRTVELWNVVPYFLSAMAGTLAVLYISKKIESTENAASRFLVNVGDNTMTILTWHFLSFKIVSVLIIFIYGLPTAALAGFPTIAHYSAQGWFVVYILVGTLVPLAMSKSRYLR